MAQKRKQKRNKSRKWLYWMVMILLFVGAAAVCYFVWDAYFRVKDDVGDNGSNKNEMVAEVKDKADEKEKNEDESDDEPVAVAEKEKIVQYEGDDPNEAEELTGAVTYAGVSGDALMIRTNIDQYLSDGKCELTLMRSGATIYSSIANIISSVATSTCDGFDVPVAELGGGGVDIIINISADERVGTLRGKADI